MCTIKNNYNDRPMLSLGPKPHFDPKHFCPSWGDCCQKNLDLKPKHLLITEGMSSEDALKVLDIITALWHCWCSNDDYTYNDCIKALLINKRDANIIINALSTCTCCKRHKLHRPSNLDNTQWSTHVRPFAYTCEDWESRYMPLCDCEIPEMSKFDIKCLCPCRSGARHIQMCFKN